MFIKTNGFKYLLKEAHTGVGLKIGNTGDTLCISGGYWRMQIKTDFLDNKAKAALIELIGDIPGAGVWVDYRKKEGGQICMDPGATYRVFDGLQTEQAKVQLTTTKVILQHHLGEIARVLKNTNTGKIHLINERYITMVSNQQIMKEKGETGVTYPMITGWTSGVVWENNVMAMEVLQRTDDQAKDLIEMFETMEMLDWWTKKVEE